MSESNEQKPEVLIENPASVEDVRRTLEELQRKDAEREKRIPELENELKAERTRRMTLEGNLDGERVARVTAETERDQHATRVVSEAENRWAAEKAATEAAITTREQSLDAAEEDFARYSDLGDWKAAAKAQRQIAESAADLRAQRDKLTYLDTNKERLIPKAPPARVETPAPRPAAHRYQRFITSDLVGGEEAWLDQRPQFQTDESYRNRVFSASGSAALEFTRGTEPYFREMERILREDSPRRGEADDDRGHDPEPRQEPRRQERQMSADLPASRRAAPGHQPAGSQPEVRLTAEEADIADGIYGNPNDENFYIADPRERYLRYHQNKLKMAARG